MKHKSTSCLLSNRQGSKQINKERANHKTNSNFYAQLQFNATFSV